jgi:hypothetical protein
MNNCCDFTHLGPWYAGNRIEVYAQLVGMVEVVRPHRMWV